MLNEVINGDALQVLRSLPTHSVDAICSDPPAGIGFMQTKDRTWDSDKGGRDKWIDWLADIMSEALRVIKPGGHALIWALPRTSHWTALALEYGGWTVREKFYHLFGSGMPKSHNISVAIDRMNGAEREVIGEGPYASRKPRPYEGGNSLQISLHDTRVGNPVTKPATPDAQKWEGWGTATKPAVEEWILARSPLSESSIAANVLRWGTGGINIDKCRIPANGDSLGRMNKPGGNGWKNSSGGANRATHDPIAASGRWPANLLLSHTLFCSTDACAEGCPVALLDMQSGMRKSGAKTNRKGDIVQNGHIYNPMQRTHDTSYTASEGYASRYFQTFHETPDVPFIYTSKASRSERNKGCEALPESNVHRYGSGIGRDDTPTSDPHRPVIEQNHHPTVKPLALCRYLVSLVTPPGGIVLDMFAGSGTTGVACIMEGYNYILVEQDSDYCEIARARLAYARGERYDMQLSENGHSKQTDWGSWGHKLVRCPIHHVSYKSGSNLYTCGCKIVYTCKDNMTI